MTENPTNPTPSTSLFNRLRSSFSVPEQDTQSEQSEGQSEASGISSPPPTYRDAIATTKTIFIKQVQLLLNGTPLDQVECRETSKIEWLIYLNASITCKISEQASVSMH